MLGIRLSRCKTMTIYHRSEPSLEGSTVFEHIYTKYRGLMFYTAKGVLQDSYLAEDAVHETFLDIIRIIDSIRANNEKELSQFLRVLTHHKAVDMVRKCTRQKKSDTEIEDM